MKAYSIQIPTSHNSTSLPYLHDITQTHCTEHNEVPHYLLGMPLAFLFVSVHRPRSARARQQERHAPTCLKEGSLRRVVAETDSCLGWRRYHHRGVETLHRLNSVSPHELYSSSAVIANQCCETGQCYQDCIINCHVQHTRL